MTPNTPHSAAGSRRTFLRGSMAAAAAAATTGAAPTRPTRAAPDPSIAPRSIHPHPHQLTWGSGLVRIASPARLTLAPGANPALIDLFKETWRRFTFDAVTLEIARDETLPPHAFTLGKAHPPKRQDDATYALAVDGSGIGASATDAAAARHAWFTLLQLLDADDAPDGSLTFAIPYVTIQDRPGLAFRGLHLCVFRETPPHMIERAIRLAALLKFTHVVLEFWGMLRLETLRELAWPDAWSKTDAARLVSIAQAMGLEVVPMFNSWGHASSSRIRHGRHVVLDQNPRLAPLFEPDGWTWCLSNARTQRLLRAVADELIEFAGPGRFFHIGCDEAYSHATCDRCRVTDRVRLFADHINGLAAHLEKRGRRAMMWGDALLERGKWPTGFSANGSPTLPTHLALDQVSRRITIADWHYGVTRGDVPTLAHFRERGFETIACPWNTAANITTLAKGAAANGSGLLMTTWHHLAQSIPILPHVAACAWSVDIAAALARPQMQGSLARAATATLLRKLVPAQGSFERAGWNTFELPAEPD